jgi:hypothetical protein
MEGVIEVGPLLLYEFILPDVVDLEVIDVRPTQGECPIFCPERLLEWVGF